MPSAGELQENLTGKLATVFCFYVVCFPIIAENYDQQGALGVVSASPSILGFLSRVGGEVVTQHLLSLLAFCRLTPMTPLAAKIQEIPLAARRARGVDPGNCSLSAGNSRAPWVWPTLTR